MLALLRRTSFWPSLHILQIKIFHMLDLCWQISWTASTPVVLTCGYSSCSSILIQIRSFTYFHWKILALARIWTRDLTDTKPIDYQLSSPGLNIETIWFYFMCAYTIYSGHKISTEVGLLSFPLDNSLKVCKNSVYFESNSSWIVL